MNNKEPKWGAISGQSGEDGSRHTEGGDWSDLAQHGVDAGDLPPSSVADWESVTGAYRDFRDELRRKGDTDLAAIVDRVGRGGAAVLADLLRDSAESNRELQRFQEQRRRQEWLEEQRRQQEGPKERFKGSLRGWLRRRRR